MIPSAHFRLMTHNSEGPTGFTMQINAYMQRTASLDFRYTNYESLWRNGNSTLSKCNFSFVYTSVNHSTWITIKFPHSSEEKQKNLIPSKVANTEIHVSESVNVKINPGNIETQTGRHQLSYFHIQPQINFTATCT